jgi:hypothetical protein
LNLRALAREGKPENKHGNNATPDPVKVVIRSQKPLDQYINGPTQPAVRQNNTDLSPENHSQVQDCQERIKQSDGKPHHIEHLTKSGCLLEIACSKSIQTIQEIRHKIKCEKQT